MPKVKSYKLKKIPIRTFLKDFNKIDVMPNVIVRRLRAALWKNFFQSGSICQYGDFDYKLECRRRKKNLTRKF